MPGCSRDDIPRAHSGTRSNQIPGNRYEETEYATLIHQRGGDCDCRKWVWRLCDGRVWPCPLQVIHMSKKLYLFYTPETAKAHVAFVCKWTHSPPPLTSHRVQSALHSVLTRVSSGIKEALRAEQKHSTCFLKERKHKRRGRLFLRWFKVLERKCAQNDNVDIPRVLLVLEIILPLLLDTLVLRYIIS